MKDDDDDDDSAARPLKLTCPCRRLCLLPPVLSALCTLQASDSPSVTDLLLLIKKKCKSRKSK